jgi:hypothetical protein
MTQERISFVMSRNAMLIDALAGTANDLRRLTKPVSDVQAGWRSAVAAWCVKDVIAHLGYIEPMFRARFQRIIEQDNPFEPFMHPDERAHDLELDVSYLIDAFAREREITVLFLSGLGHRDWLRICTHATYGVTKMRKQVEILIGHDNDHLAQIVDIREQMDR